MALSGIWRRVVQIKAIEKDGLIPLWGLVGCNRARAPTRPIEELGLPWFVPQATGFRRASVQIKAIVKNDLIPLWGLVGGNRARAPTRPIEERSEQVQIAFFRALICTKSRLNPVSTSTNQETRKSRIWSRSEGWRNLARAPTRPTEERWLTWFVPQPAGFRQASVKVKAIVKDDLPPSEGWWVA